MGEFVASRSELLKDVFQMEGSLYLKETWNIRKEEEGKSEALGRYNRPPVLFVSSF